MLIFVVGGDSSPVMDAAGVVWQTGSIVESAIVSLYTVIFAVALAAVKLLQAPAMALDSPPSERTG